VLVFLTPETPAWLVSQGRPSDAQESLRWLRGHGSEAAAELQALMQKQHEHLSSGCSSAAAAIWLKQNIFKRGGQSVLQSNANCLHA
jgi:Sugar (and other) transporter